MDSRSSGLGRPTYSSLSSRPGRSIAPSMMSCVGYERSGVGVRNWGSDHVLLSGCESHPGEVLKSWLAVYYKGLSLKGVGGQVTGRLVAATMKTLQGYRGTSLIRNYRGTSLIRNGGASNRAVGRGDDEDGAPRVEFGTNKTVKARIWPWLSYLTVLSGLDCLIWSTWQPGGWSRRR